MEEAQYGRLQVGRCVTRDYGYLGCSANVIDLLDKACSGQRWCQYGIPRLRELVQPCPKDLTAYLEAKYRCITGKRLWCCNQGRIEEEGILGWQWPPLMDRWSLRFLDILIFYLNFETRSQSHYMRAPSPFLVGPPDATPLLIIWRRHWSHGASLFLRI